MRRGIPLSLPIQRRRSSMWRFLLASLAAFLVATDAATGQTSKPAAEILNNKSVIKMTTAKLPTDLIVARIEVLPGEYDVSTEALLELSNAKVPTAVIRAMMAKSAAATRVPAPVPASPSAPVPGAKAGMPTATSAPSAALDANIPAEAGIYVVIDSVGASAYRLLEPSAYSQGKSGGYLKSALTYGIAKSTTKAVIRGETANTQVRDGSPVFYFVFEQKNAGLSNAGGFFGNGVTSPNEFTLIRLKVNRNSRETTVLSSNAFGSQSGTSDKAVVPFAFTRLRPGVYKVTMRDPLEVGEYCFISAAGITPIAGVVSSNRLWDFSVR